MENIDCVVCNHPDRNKIEKRIMSGEPLSQILRDYPYALYSHKIECMGEKEVQIKKKSENKKPKTKKPKTKKA